MTEEKKVNDNVIPGATVRVHQQIKETNAKGEEKQRVQVFEGMIISKRHGNEPRASITVRKVTGGVGVEKTFPLQCPNIVKIEALKQARVRRAKLGYLKKYKKRLKEKKL